MNKRKLKACLLASEARYTSASLKLNLLNPDFSQLAKEKGRIIKFTEAIERKEAKR